MTRVYLASPTSQQKAEHCCDQRVLLSFAMWRPALFSYCQTFSSILLDSGAFSVLNSGKTIDVGEYIEWVAGFAGQIDAYAGLDDIAGDWRQSLKNYERGGFPTFHDSDPTELLDDLISIARERGSWIGIGLVPPRNGKRDFLERTLARIPDDFHVHGWALRSYSFMRRFDSFDSTNWWRSAMQHRQKLPWLTYGECLEIQIKRIVRESRMVDHKPRPDHTQQEFRL